MKTGYAHRVGMRLALSNAVVIMLLGIGWLASARATSDIQASYRNAVVKNDALSNQILMITTAMLDQETGSRAYFLTGERRFLRTYNKSRAELPIAYVHARALGEDATDLRMLGLVLRRAHTWQTWAQTELRLWNISQHSVVRDGASVSDGARLFGEFRSAAGFELRRVQLRRQSALASSRQVFTQANVILAAIILTAMAIIALIGWREFRSIAKPLRQLRAAASRMRRGDFDVPVPCTGNDEIALLAADMDVMRNHLGVRHRIGDLLASRFGLDEIYPDFAAAVKTLVPFDRLSVSLVDDDRTETVTAYAEGTDSDPYSTGERRLTDNSILDRAARTGEPVLIVDAASLGADDVDWVSFGIRSIVMMPLRSKARLVGILNVSSSRAHAYDESTVATLAALTQPLANAIENAHLYQDISEANAEMERVSRLKSEFVANMSHELRTPLNAIIGFSEVLQAETFGSLNDRQRRYVGNVVESGRQLLGLVNDILDISKVEAGHMGLHQEDLDVTALLTQAVEKMEPLAHSKKIALQIEANGHAPLLHADRARFTQIILNLLSNAIKFTPSGGTVGLSYHTGEDLVSVAVKDTGIGISEDDQARIFEEFEQVDSSVGRTQQGTGLGLALTKKLVELHGGTIRIDSRLGSGSTFTVAVPRARPAERVHGVRGDVLVVEDDPAARELLTVYLTGAGYGVTCVERVADVLPSAIACTPVAITLDLVLDDESGWVALEQLKAQPETRDIPVIIISILDEQRKGVALGASAYLTKPIVAQEFFDVLDRLVAAPISAPRGHLRVLAVDDQPEALELIALALEDSGHELIRATNGAGALESIASEKPDVMIVDLMMQPISGFELIETVAADAKLRRIPIVVWTARELMTEDLARLKNGHVAATLSKTDFAGAGKHRLLRELELVAGRKKAKGSLNAAR